MLGCVCLFCVVVTAVVGGMTVCCVCALRVSVQTALACYVFVVAAVSMIYRCCCWCGFRVTFAVTTYRSFVLGSRAGEVKYSHLQHIQERSESVLVCTVVKTSHLIHFFFHGSPSLSIFLVV